MFCKKCGAEVNDEAVVCVKCGCSLVDKPIPQVEEDKPNAGFAVLGFFFPLIGFILWLVWKKDYPLKAKSCGKGALIGIIASVVFYIVCIVGLVSCAACLDSYYYY